MSVICQNFVQNAWKKDLCSNCFKSLSDHESQPTLVHPCIVESPRNGLGPQINARYVSQATTIYHSRGFLNHAAWKSLIADRQDGGNGYLFKLENGFHSKLLSISANDLDKNCQNSNKVFTSIMKTTTKRQQISTKMSLSVGFKEEDPLVIGYGGNDYDSDDHDWEMGSDDGDFPLGSLDDTSEDRAITKMTKENTEFNSKNDNLLKGCVASCFTNGVLPNGSVGQHTTEGSPTVERVKNKDDDVRSKVEKSLQQTENSGRKLLNGISSSQCLRKEFPPRASVRPILREEPATVKGHQGDEVRCEPVNSLDVRTEINSPKNSTVISDAEPCEDALLDEVGIIHESVIVLVDSNDCPAEMNISEMSEHSDPNVTARTSFLHGMGQEESPCSAIYTPGNNDLFISKTSSSSSEEPTDESDSGSDHPQVQQFETTVTSEIEKLNIGHEQKTPISPSVKPPKPARNTIAKKEDPPSSVSETTSFALDNEVTVISNKSESPTADKSIYYYAVSSPLAQYNAENNIYQEVGKQSSDRVSKLAALAQELEQARCPGSSKRQAPAPPKPTEQLNGSSSGPPSLSPVENVNHFKEPTSSTKIYGFPFELKTKSATMSSVQGKKVLAILNFDDNGNTSSNNNKGKKGKFSIKKFLKRGKDMESIDQIFQNHNTPNPKAWKQADFDRSKLRLEILHPMDLANKNELQSSSTEESSHETSSFTDSDTNQDGIGTAEEIQRGDGIYDDEFTWHSSPDNSQLVTQIEGANQSAESNGFGSLTNSTCSSSSAVPSNPTSPTDSTQAIYSQYKNNARPVRPPKPPPPPRLRSVIPNKSTPNGKATESPICGKEDPPVVPQKPQVPKRLYKQNSVSDYANLGDIRSNIAPRKPERSPINLCSQSSQEEENQYEPVGDYDNQLYQDTSELYEERLYCEPPNENHFSEENSMCTASPFSLKDGSARISSVSNETSHHNPYWKDNDKVTLTVQPACTYDRKPGDDPNRHPPGCGGEKLDASAWLSLEQSYAIVAAANHEVLAKLLDQVMHQKSSSLQKPDGQNIQWADFYLQPSYPMKTVGEKLIYNAVQRHIPQRQVTLVATLQTASPAAKETPSKHLLGYFTDELPKSALPAEWLSTKEGTQALIYILPKTDVSSIQSSFLVNRMEKNDPSCYEKDICFVTLQLIQALKILQAHGTEEVDLNVENLILAKDDKDQMSNLVLLSADMGNELNTRKMTLCQCAVAFLEKISNNNCLDNLNKGQPGVGTLTRKVFATVARVLVQEKASSLSRARQLLEYYLWGPKDQNSQPLYIIHRAEDTLQRWLDIERAHSLRLLVRSHKNISAFEEHQLQFLVRTNAVNLKDLAYTLNQ